MKRYGVLVFLFVCIAGTAKAQTVDLSGVIKDEEGQPVHFAFLKDVQSKTSTYTDSLGAFNIKIDSKSSLFINCFGFKDTVLKVAGRTAINISLKTSVNIAADKTSQYKNAGPNHAPGAQAQADNMTLDRTHSVDPGHTATVTVFYHTAYNIYTQHLDIIDAGPGSIYPSFNPKEETQGSRYLLKGWIHGYVINAKDSVIQDPSYLFEYDKMGGGLLMTRNRASAIEVDRDVVHSFTLYDNNNVSYTFENVPQIDSNHYVQVISSCDRYKIYKATKTTFERANFTTDGVMNSGHNYDLYTDEYTYYVYDMKTNALQKMPLKKKSIKLAFEADADKLSRFMSDHSSDSIDDMYLQALCESLN